MLKAFPSCAGNRFEVSPGFLGAGNCLDASLAVLEVVPITSLKTTVHDPVNIMQHEAASVAHVLLLFRQERERPGSASDLLLREP